MSEQQGKTMQTISRQKHVDLLQDPDWRQHVGYFDERRLQHQNAWREYVGTLRGIDHVVDVTID